MRTWMCLRISVHLSRISCGICAIPLWRQFCEGGIAQDVLYTFMYIYIYICVCVYIHKCVNRCVDASLYIYLANRAQCMPYMWHTFRNAEYMYVHRYVSRCTYACVYTYVTHRCIYACVYTYVAYRAQCMPCIWHTFRNNNSSARYTIYTYIHIYIYVFMNTHICIYTYVTYRAQCMPCTWHTFCNDASSANML